MSEATIPVVPYQCLKNLSEEIARTIIRKSSSTLSMTSSLYVLRVIYKKYRKKASSIDPYQRIMAGLCVYDIIFSFFWWFMGSWMTPKETGWWGATGTTLTCTIQGALTDFALIGIWSYQTLLSLFMVMLVVYGWNPNKFQRKIERRVHAPIFVVGILYFIAPAVENNYNPECGHCAPVPLPIWSGDWIFGDGSTPLRGNATLAYVYWIIFFILLPAVTIFCSAAMYKVYRSVNKQERRMTNYGSFSDNHFSESRRIRRTMILYTSSFLICWIVPVLFLWTPHRISALSLIGDFLMPLQGFFNMLVFLQPKCQKYQKEHEGTGLFAAYAYVIFDFSGVMRRGRAFGSGFSVTTVSTDVDDGIGFGQYNSKNRFGKRFGNSKSDEASIIKWERMNSADSGKMESEGIIENDSKKDLDKELENMEMEGISLDGIDNIDIEGLSLGGSSDPEMERNTTDGIGNLVMEGIPEVMMDVDVDMNETRRISRVSFLTDASGDATNPESAESATIGDVTMQGYPEEIVDVDVKVKEKRRTPRVTFSVDVSGDATTTEVP